jgi:hypothetical protein
MNNKATAKDFFLHLGAIVSFYASAIALTTLLFQVINYAYPKITNAYQYYTPSISFQVATLIVAFPLFLFLSWLLQKSYAAEPALRETAVRRWLAYITLFVAGAVAAGDLVTLVYYFLDGQELTTAFVLKVLALFVVASGIFLYYFREIRNKIAPAERNAWRIAAALAILVSIAVGFMVIGSPADQRAKRLDSQRLSDLQTIQWQVVNFYQQKGFIPSALSELEDPISGFVVPRDPQTGAPYEYKLIGQSAKAFELCATFERAGSNQYYNGSMAAPTMPTEAGMKAPESWQHEAGRTCFSRAIDPQLYPVRTR